MGKQDVGSAQPFQLSIPEGMELWFENELVVVRVDSTLENFPAGVLVKGPTLSSGSYSLTITRTSEGVEIVVQG